MRFSGVAFGSMIVWLVANGCATPGGVAAGSSTGEPGPTGASGGGAPAPSCPPSALCDAGPVCLSLEDYDDKQIFNLRMSRFTFTAPKALAEDHHVQNAVVGGVTPNLPGCGVNGPATFSWIMQFNMSASTLQTGIAKLVTDPTEGYTFINEPMMQGGTTYPIGPVAFHDVDLSSDGSFSVKEGLDLNVPIYLDSTGTNFVIIPLHKARMFAGRVAPDHNCIGHYNAEGLDPAKGCAGDISHPLFIAGAKVDGYITLEEADTIVSTSFGISLCFFLTGKGDGGAPVKCARSNGAIVAEGDWCSATNDGASCTDAVRLAADFAASAVRVKN